MWWVSPLYSAFEERLYIRPERQSTVWVHALSRVWTELLFDHLGITSSPVSPSGWYSFHENMIYVRLILGSLCVFQLPCFIFFVCVSFVEDFSQINRMAKERRHSHCVCVCVYMKMSYVVFCYRDIYLFIYGFISFNLYTSFTQFCFEGIHWLVDLCVRCWKYKYQNQTLELCVVSNIINNPKFWDINCC